MATKKFNLEQVTEHALKVFWQRGYHGTSVQHLVAATGLKPGSLYHQFGSKDGLFRVCLQHYAEQSISSSGRTIESSENVLAGIRLVLTQLLDASCQEDYCGCFLIKTQLELSSEQSEAYQYCLQSFDRINAHFTQYLTRVFAAEQSALYAQQLMLVIYAIRVVGYQGQAPDSTQQAYQAMLPWLFEHST